MTDKVAIRNVHLDIMQNGTWRINFLGEVVEDRVKRKKEGQQRQAGGGKESDNYTRQELGKGKGKAARVQ